MPFGLKIRVGPRNHALDWGLRPLHMQRCNFFGEGTYPGMFNDTAVSCAKMAEPIKIPFGLWTWVVPRKHVLGGVHIGATWRIPLNRRCAAAMRPFCQITSTTCWCFVSHSSVFLAVCRRFTTCRPMRVQYAVVIQCASDVWI